MFRTSYDVTIIQSISDRDELYDCATVADINARIPIRWVGETVDKQFFPRYANYIPTRRIFHGDAHDDNLWRLGNDGSQFILTSGTSRIPQPFHELYPRCSIIQVVYLNERTGRRSTYSMCLRRRVRLAGTSDRATQGTDTRHQLYNKWLVGVALRHPDNCRLTFALLWHPSSTNTNSVAARETSEFLKKIADMPNRIDKVALMTSHYEPTDLSTASGMIRNLFAFPNNDRLVPPLLSPTVELDCGSLTPAIDWLARTANKNVKRLIVRGPPRTTPPPNGHYSGLANYTCVRRVMLEVCPQSWSAHDVSRHIDDICVGLQSLASRAPLECIELHITQYRAHATDCLARLGRLIRSFDRHVPTKVALLILTDPIRHLTFSSCFAFWSALHAMRLARKVDVRLYLLRQREHGSLEEKRRRRISTSVTLLFLARRHLRRAVRSFRLAEAAICPVACEHFEDTPLVHWTSEGHRLTVGGIYLSQYDDSSREIFSTLARIDHVGYLSLHFTICVTNSRRGPLQSPPSEIFSAMRYLRKMRHITGLSLNADVCYRLQGPGMRLFSTLVTEVSQIPHSGLAAMKIGVRGARAEDFMSFCAGIRSATFGKLSLEVTKTMSMSQQTKQSYASSLARLACDNPCLVDIVVPDALAHQFGTRWLPRLKYNQCLARESEMTDRGISFSNNNLLRLLPYILTANSGMGRRWQPEWMHRVLSQPAVLNHVVDCCADSNYARRATGTTTSTTRASPVDDSSSDCCNKTRPSKRRRTDV